MSCPPPHVPKCPLCPQMSPVTHPLVHLHLDARLSVELKVEGSGTGGVLLWWWGDTDDTGVSGEGTAVSPPLDGCAGGRVGQKRGDRIGPRAKRGVTGLGSGTPGHEEG